MSYARFGWHGSDVYVFYSVSGMYECCFCHLDVGEKVQQDFPTAAEMIDHLMLHRAAGHTVPDDTFDDLRKAKP